jgi:tripartite-type tricarboxylate transporter receptor subunit TctC
MPLMHLIPIFVVLGACLFAAASPAAETFPQRPIRLVVPTGAGGNTDTFARVLAERLRIRLGQPVIVDNRPGADGIVGSEIVARANADGYTLLMAFPTHPVNPFLHANMPYDTLNDFAPVSMVTSVTQVLLVNPKVSARSIRELIALAAEKPGALNSGAVARGSLGDLCTELFESLAKVKFTHIAYKGAPQVMTALIAGEVQVYFAPPVVAIPQVKAGRVRALGVSTRLRLASLPDVPTIADTGLPGYEVVGWNGVLAPAQTPRAVVERLHAAIVQVVRSPEFEAEATAQGVNAIGNTPEEFARSIRTDMEKWAKLLRSASGQAGTGGQAN